PSTPARQIECEELEEVRKELERTTRYLTVMNVSRQISNVPTQLEERFMSTVLRSFETPKGLIRYTLYLPEDELYTPIHELSLQQPFSRDIYPLINPSYTLESKTASIIAQLIRAITSTPTLKTLTASFCSAVLPRIPVHSPELWKTKQVLLSSALRNSSPDIGSPNTSSPGIVRSGSSMTES
ncbi:hypothetical protein PROFUN_17053, partial [Planoprotostelium fungivorum]